MDDACAVSGHGSGIMWSVGATGAAETMAGGLVPEKRGELWYLKSLCRN